MRRRWRCGRSAKVHGAPFLCHCKPEFGCEFAALPATHQSSAIANRVPDLSYAHAAGDLIEQLLSYLGIELRELVADAAPLR